ncbi:MAG TPA: hypothetical protein VG406_21935 [Isosphaeraceae bacterium]|jgi:hypothetical protein|nr:hypothetical protein [Isosphaeraceae bacterium]
MRNAERVLAAYAEAEPWREDHDAAGRCFELEEVVAVGNLAFQLIVSIDAAWQGRVAAGLVPYRDEDDRRIGELHRMWVEASERRLGEIEALGREGFEVQGAEEFLIHLDEARSLIESRALEAQMRPIEEVLPLARGNPRPERYGA